MTTVLMAGQNIEVDKEGFLLNPDQWTPEMAVDLAAENGIELTEKHWQVIDFCRRSAAEKGASPTVRGITKGTGISTKEMYQLFPKGPGILSAKIAGLSKPRGCI
ncbi:MAG: TusE/DsrC/DsvC family sulfur relay protein [Gemmatimonadota bacterium]|jgi:TusE/DsrC/DsvC family sulfur relay protein